MIEMKDTPEGRSEIAARIKSEGGIRIINISPSIKKSKRVRRIIIRALEKVK